MKWFSLFLLCFIPFSITRSQNALNPGHLTITDHVQVVEDEDSPRYHHPLMWRNQENINLSQDIDLTDLIWEAMTEDKVEYYDGNVIFDQDFPVTIPGLKEAGNNLHDIYDIPDTFDLIYSPHELYSIIFVENWILDEENFNLDKEVTGILPVRHWTRLDPSGNPIEGARIMMPVAYIPYPEKRSWFESRRINKRLVPIKKISYEFMLSEIHFLSWYDSDISMHLDKIPLIKYRNAQWGNFHAEQLRRVILEKAFSGSRNVVNLETGETLGEEEIAGFFDYHRNTSGKYSQLAADDAAGGWDVDFSGIPSFIGLHEQIFSVIFTEEWAIDPETLFIKKKVLAITPVFWLQEWNENEETVWQKKTFFRIKLN